MVRHENKTVVLYLVNFRRVLLSKDKQRFARAEFLVDARQHQAPEKSSGGGAFVHVLNRTSIRRPGIASRVAITKY